MGPKKEATTVDKRKYVVVTYKWGKAYPHTRVGVPWEMAEFIADRLDNDPGMDISIEPVDPSQSDNG